MLKQQLSAENVFDARKAVDSNSSVIYAFLDTNIILEGKPLHQLPWHELGAPEAIVISLTNKVMSEIDAKKPDGRRGEVARQFNRLIAPAAFGRITLPGASGAIFLQLTATNKFDWSNYPELDPNDSDSLILLQVLNAKGISDEQKVLISNDLKPIWLATSHGLKAIHVGADWLRGIEPHPKDKEIQRLKQELADLKKKEPKLRLEINALSSEHVAYLVDNLTAADRSEIDAGILDRNPRPLVDGLSLLSRQYRQETCDDSEYDDFRRRAIPQFIDRYVNQLEETLGQIPFEISFYNEGPVRAENLVVAVEVSSGWMNPHPVDYSLHGPSPKSKRSSVPETVAKNSEKVIDATNRHDVLIAIEPRKSRVAEFHCADFHVGKESKFSWVLFLDPNETAPVQISARITAANLHGSLESNQKVFPNIVKANARELVELSSGWVMTTTVVQNRLREYREKLLKSIHKE